VLRVLALLVVAWAAGFVLFMMSIGTPLDPARRTDAIVVLTGGAGRMDRGLALIGAKVARRMLVSGVDPDVRPIELAVRYKVPARLFSCCIDLGHAAVDTRSNAEETAEWVQRHGFKTVRLVTTDWHMPRARLELRRALADDVEVIGDAIPTSPRLKTLFREYHKYLVRRLVLLVSAG
jgi:uncharacterized SAM-binding protein YcdF (DUF218 family)